MKPKSMARWLTTSSACAALAITAYGTPAFGQDAELGASATDEIITTGTRRTQRTAVDTPAPIDVISAVEFTQNASTDIQDLLRTSVPSFNVATQPISDDATIVRPANLRGLSPDQTLVLVNGKRRHRASIITFFGGGISDGAQGVDIDSIPSIALKQVEILRDGASSQYGSDAIAGVINFVLKDAPEGGTIEAQYGSTYQGDGDQYRIAGNVGLPLGDQGFVNLSAEYGQADGTSRSFVRPDVADFIAAGNSAAGDFSTITGGFNDEVPQYWGRSEVDDNIKFFVNSALAVSENTEFYLSGNYSEKTVSNGFFYRAPTNFFSIFAGPDVDPVTGAASGAADSVGSLQVGDLDGLGMGGDCPAGIPLLQGANLADPAISAQVAADPNCFSLNEVFPGGFTPRFGGDNSDYGVSFGARGIWNIGNGMSYDVSLTHGGNRTEYFLLNSINPSLANASPRDFRPGSQEQVETVVNADFAYLVPLDLASDLSVAFGLEYRKESFDIGRGDAASFARGPLTGQGFLTGASGFTGFSQDREASQDAYGAYVELEADVTEALTLQGALRYEDYSEFDDTVDYKIAALYKVSDGLRFRATHSTGFHAPTAGQANVQRVSTEIRNRALADIARLPLDSAAGQLTADFVESNFEERPTLSSEDSQSFTLGAAFDLGPSSWSIDAYQVDVDDRISISQEIDFGDVLQFAAAQSNVTLAPGNSIAQSLNQLSGAGVIDAADFTGFENLQGVSYFSNGFDTRTRGVDVVGTLPFSLFGGFSEVTLAANYNETDVTGISTANPIDGLRILRLEELLPNWKGFASWTHQQDKWRTLVRANYFGSWLDSIYAGSVTDTFSLQDMGAELLVDAEIGYELTDGVEIMIGATNLFDNYPDESETLAQFFGQQYPDFSPTGFTGGQYYGKIRINF